MKGLLIFVVLLLVTAIGCVWLPFIALPSQGLGAALPVIYVPGEPLATFGELPGGIEITNTFVSAILTSVIVLGAILLMRLWWNPEKPGRLQGFFELVVEAWDGLARSSAGPKGRQLLPLALSIFFFLLFANVMKVFPGVDTVGELHCAGIERGSEDDPEFVPFNGYPIHDSTFLGINVLKVERVEGKTVNTGERISQDEWHACHEELLHGDDEAAAEETAVEHEEESEAVVVAAEGDGDNGEGTHAEGEGDAHAEGAAEHHAENPELYVVTPFVRGPSTDLALTFAIALIAMLMVQFFGIKELGPLEYGAKFINLPALGRGGMGFMDFAVGLLETFLEMAKVVSFAFRLFGAMFGGQVLMFVIVFLVATFVPIVVVGLEVFLGAIQAFVFAILFLMFSSVAMTSHSHDDEHHDAHEAHH